MTTPAPAYTWHVSPGANRYYLAVDRVDSGTEGPVFRSHYYPSEVCTGDLCTAAPGLSLPAGNYIWGVQAWNADGKTWTWGLGFTVQPPPAPVPSTPTGVIYTPTPSFTWSASSGATQYFLKVGTGSATIFQSYYDASQVCAGGSCSITPALSLAVGSYVWLVQAKNASGGTWSGESAFAVQGPPAPATVSPSASITTATPTYVWNAVAGYPTDYVLSVEPVAGSGGTTAFQIWYTAVEVCSGATCSATPSNALKAAGYFWYVRATNAAGLGAWSEGRTFTVQPPQAPGLVSPSGVLYTPTPTYRWSPVSGTVSHYILSVEPAPGTTDGTANFTVWSTPAEVCPGSVCAVTPTAPGNVLKPGNYLWQVRALGATGFSPWSGSLGISVEGPPPPNPLSPSGPETTVTPRFTWGAVGGEVMYYILSVDRGNEHVYNVWYDPSVCSSGLCSATPTIPLRTGTYSWAMLARNAVGPSVWSYILGFTVQTPPPPTPLSPQGVIPSDTPTFTWTVSNGAMGYTLSVLNQNGQTVYEEIMGLEACTGGTCAATPAHPLAVGASYGWRVRGQHLGGFGDWSATVGFQVASFEDCTGEFVTADFNGDNLDDQACSVANAVYVALGDGTGGYQPERAWLFYSFTRLLVGDFDGDGKDDLADVKVQSGEFFVARSTGTAFTTPSSWGVAQATWNGTSYTCQGEYLAAGTGDFNTDGPDGRTDVYCFDSSARLFLGLSTGTSFQFSIPEVVPPGVVPTQEYIYSGSRPLAITGAPPQ